MTSEIVFLCVVVFVASATTLVCQIFGKICAQKLIEIKYATRCKYSPPKVKRKRSHSISSYDSSYDGSISSQHDYTSSSIRVHRKSGQCTPLDVRDLDRKYTYHESKPNKIKARKDLIIRNQDARKNRWRQRENRRKNRPRPNFSNRNSGQLTGTFSRLGIPADKEVLPERLKSIINQLEDKNLSPMTDTLVSGFDSINSNGSLFLNNLVARRLTFNPEEQTPNSQPVGEAKKRRVASITPYVQSTGSDSVFANKSENFVNGIRQHEQDKLVVNEQKTENSGQSRDSKSDITVEIEQFTIQENPILRVSSPISINDLRKQSYPDVVAIQMCTDHHPKTETGVGGQTDEIRPRNCRSCGMELVCSDKKGSDV